MEQQSANYLRAPPVEISNRSKRASLRNSFRDLHVPKIWTDIRDKSASELNLVLEVVRGSPSLSCDRLSHPNKQENFVKNMANKKRGHQKVCWRYYKPQYLNKQLHIGSYFYERLSDF